jgi:Tfp pilus assembly protein PilO
MIVYGRTAKRFGLLHIDAAGAGACVLASLAFSVLTVQPFLQRRLAVARQRRELDVLTHQASKIATALTATEEQLTVVRNERAASTLTLDSAAHINKRVAGLAAFFSNCELEVDDVQTGRVCNGLRCDVIPITVVGRGSYEQYARFLHGLCSSFPDLSVVKIELTGNPAQVSGFETFRFELIWYAASDTQISTVSQTRFLREIMVPIRSDG